MGADVLITPGIFDGGDEIFVDFMVIPPAERELDQPDGDKDMKYDLNSIIMGNEIIFFKRALRKSDVDTYFFYE